MTIDAPVARAIRIVIFDADGVLTDGGVYVTDEIVGRSVQLRRFDIKDGIGIYMLRQAGIEPVIVSGRDSPALRSRADELQIDEVYQVHPFRKVRVVEEMLEERDLEWTQAACMADDLADVGLMERVALPASVPDAVDEVLERAVWRSESTGGSGAVREFAEELLTARGEWEELLHEYLEGTRGNRPDEV